MASGNAYPKLQSLPQVVVVTENMDFQPRCAGKPSEGQVRSALRQGKPHPSRCGALLAEFVTRPWLVKCPRCGHRNFRRNAEN